MAGGCSLQEFQNSTRAEYMTYIEAYRERTRDQAVMSYRTAWLIGFAVNDPRKYPSLEKAFPGMFPEQESRSVKENLRRWVEAKNRNMQRR